MIINRVARFLPLMLLLACGRQAAKPMESSNPKATSTDSSSVPVRQILFPGTIFENILHFKGAIDICASDEINGKTPLNAIDNLWETTAKTILEEGADEPDGYTYHSTEYASLNPYQQQYAQLLLADSLAAKFKDDPFSTISSSSRRWLACNVGLSHPFPDQVELRVTNQEADKIVVAASKNLFLYKELEPNEYQIDPDGGWLSWDNYHIDAPRFDSLVRRYSIVVGLPDTYELYLEGSKKFGPLDLTVHLDKDGEDNTRAHFAFKVTADDLDKTGSSKARLVLRAFHPNSSPDGSDDSYHFATLATISLREPEAPVATKPIRGTGGGTGPATHSTCPPGDLSCQ